MKKNSIRAFPNKAQFLKLIFVSKDPLYYETNSLTNHDNADTRIDACHLVCFDLTNDIGRYYFRHSFSFRLS